MTKAFSLYELNSLVTDVIEQTLSESYWVEAELSEVRENRGHCYMELIQKEEQSNVPLARASAKCWRSVWSVILPYFTRITGQLLHPGMQIMLQVHPQFHPQYGFSWIVDDINPEFTMGDMMRKRQEIIKQLKAQGVFELQKELVLPLFAQRIAVISSKTAAGYGDFCNQLLYNDYALSFSVTLFPAVMQGETVETSVIEALNAINDQVENFDCVVIIRGGGATADMSGFDTLQLAENVANFPLPIITGIGHDRDESILDMVSFCRVKTPTAAAAYLVDALAMTLSRVERAQEIIVDYVNKKLEIEQLRLQHLSDHIPVLFSLVRTKEEAMLKDIYQQILTKMKEQLTRCDFTLSKLSQQLHSQSQRLYEREVHKLDLIQYQLQSLDPATLLKRGYSITTHMGKAIYDTTSLEEGDTIVTHLANGTIESKVTKWIQ